MAKKKKVKEDDEEVEETTDAQDEEIEGSEESEEAQESEDTPSEASGEQIVGGEEEEATGSKGRQKRRVIRIRKSKKERENPLAAAIRLAVDSGKVEFGIKNATRGKDKAKVLIIASRSPLKMFTELSTHSKSSGIPTIEFEGTPLELGSACGKPFNVSVVAIYEVGASKIADLAKKK